MPKLRHKIDPIDELNAGPELDSLVDEKIFGREYIRGYGALPYSTDIGAAWEVVEKMAVQDWDAEISLCSRLPSDNHERWYCGFQQGDDNAPWRSDFKFVQDWALTASLAICRAALKAIDAQTSS